MKDNRILYRISLGLVSLMYKVPYNKDRGVDQANEVDETKYSQDPLHGIGGSMTLARIKRMKDILQGLILQVQDRKVVLEDSKTKF